jgi:ribonuclease P protein component
VLYVYPQTQPGPGSRFAFSVGGRVGKAARRNRVKRRLREIVRRRLERVEPGHDCLFVARTAAGMADFEELDEAVIRLLARSGMIIGEES